MLEIIYRIYEVCEPTESAFEYQNLQGGNKRIISQEVLICQSRKQFKEIISDLYSGDNIRFKASSSYPVGQKYCVIIGEQCYDTESYMTVIKCVCDTCKVEFQTLSRHIYAIDNYTIEHYLGADYNNYGGLKFCSSKCREKGIQHAKLEVASENNLPDNFDGWVSPHNLSIGKGGYIYKITKRSTGEFYVGQSIYVPVFRWGQHLKTNRFPLSCIEDYIFEVIESINSASSLNDREKYWIQKEYKKHPDLSLNISLTKGLESRML